MSENDHKLPGTASLGELTEQLHEARDRARLGVVVVERGDRRRGAVGTNGVRANAYAIPGPTSARSVCSAISASVE